MNLDVTPFLINLAWLVSTPKGFNKKFNINLVFDFIKIYCAVSELYSCSSHRKSLSLSQTFKNDASLNSALYRYIINKINDEYSKKKFTLCNT